jgi:hypothetical protein
MLFEKTWRQNMVEAKNSAEVEPAEEMPLAAEDHGLTAGSENEDVAVPEGAGATAEAMVPPTAESAESLPPIREEDDLTPTPTLGSAAPLQGEELPADPEMVTKFITDARLDKLWTRADTAKKEVDEKVHTLDIARALLDQIRYARNYLLAGRHFFDKAERHVNEVEFRVTQNFKSRKWSILYGVPILIYEILIAVGLVLLFFFLGTSTFKSFSEDLGGMLAAMIWGGLGGVVGAWLALIKHTSQEQDFDRQHTLWYINSPFMGALIGAFIYWVMRAGLISLTGGDIKTIDSPYIIYILAWLAGYQHNVFTSIVKRILKILEIGTENSAAAKTEEKPPAAPKPPTVVVEEGDQGGEGSPKPQG